MLVNGPEGIKKLVSFMENQSSIKGNTGITAVRTERILQLDDHELHEQKKHSEEAETSEQCAWTDQCLHLEQQQYHESANKQHSRTKKNLIIIHLLMNVAPECVQSSANNTAKEKRNISSLRFPIFHSKQLRRYDPQRQLHRKRIVCYYSGSS